MNPPPYPPYTGWEPCCTTDPDIFHAQKSNPVGIGPEKVRALCHRCPTLGPCREWAIWWEPDGIWGGMTPNERRAVRKKRGITSSRGTAA